MDGSGRRHYRPAEMKSRRPGIQFLLIVMAASIALALALGALVLLPPGGDGSSRAGANTATAVVIVLLTIVFCVACALAAKTYLRRTHGPLEKLAESAEKAVTGDLNSPIEVAGDDLVARTARAVDGLRAQLRVTARSRNYLYELLDSMSEAVIVTDLDGVIQRSNRAAAGLLASNTGELKGKLLWELFAESVRPGISMDQLAGSGGESLMITADGEEIPVSYTSAAISDGRSGPEGFVLVARNISERKRAERRIRYLARFDALTRIPNRMQFQHLLQRALAKARKRGARTALLYIDLDRFKEVNDTFGHIAGDRCLETAAERLGESLPEGAVIGRLAGDEFGVMITDLGDLSSSRETLMEIAKTLQTELSRAYHYEHLEIFLSASVGVAFAPDDAGNVIDLIRNADAAMYRAKHHGGNSIEFYRPEMNVSTVEQLMLKSKLRRAIERGEFLLRYQPKMDIRDGRIVGAEALLRWKLPGRGEVAPTEFIPLAEESSVILELGDWVLKQVCEDYREWQNAGAHPGRVAINLSLRQIRQKDLTQTVRDRFREYRISPTCIEFEITESTLMEDPAATVNVLNEFYAMGVNLAIDDFGTGYSSLSSLQQFPISTLKIDQSFVRDADIDSDDATIVSTIIEMGRSLNMDVVAEGVETEGQLNFLREKRCHYVQGHLLGGPLTAPEFLELLLGDMDGSGRHRALFAVS